MKYRYETVKKDYRDFASGRILYNVPGAAPFPVRLASEIFCRAFEFLKPAQDGYKVYDPCCGSGYLLTVLGFLHASKIKEIVATDYDEKMVEFAEKNLSLLSCTGLRRREEEIRESLRKYGKTSHVEALASVETLKSFLKKEPFKITCFQRDITKPDEDPVKNVNVIMTDLPYGNLVSWYGNEKDPLYCLFENIWKAIDVDNSVVVITAGKKTKFEHERFKRVHHFKAGKRHIAFFKPLSS